MSEVAIDVKQRRLGGRGHHMAIPYLLKQRLWHARSTFLLVAGKWLDSCACGWLPPLPAGCVAVRGLGSEPSPRHGSWSGRRARWQPPRIRASGRSFPAHRIRGEEDTARPEGGG